MVDVEAVELAVAHEIDAGLLLRVDHDARRVDHRLLGRQRAEPVRKRIGADDGRLDAQVRGSSGEFSRVCSSLLAGCGLYLVSDWLLSMPRMRVACQMPGHAVMT